jgi:hypothetical protein
MWARVESLSPGEYSPVLRFLADGASEQAEESKLALTLQIRHHWWIAVVVILLGSAAGWYGNKYTAGYWVSRTLKREAELWSQDATALARPDPRGNGWRFSGEATSYALARIRVILNQLRHLTGSVFQVIVVEQEIRDRLAEAKRRLAALEVFRAARLKVQDVATKWPAAQRVIGRRLRRALDILDRPALGEPEMAEVDALLKEIEGWLSPERGEVLYREAVLGRIRELLATVAVADLPTGQMRNQITALLEEVRKVDEVAQPTAQALLPYDRQAARLELLWRDRRKPWAQGLADAQAADQVLEDLYDLTDRAIWEQIRAAAQERHLQIMVATSEEGRARAYDLVDMRLALQGGPLAECDLIRHPCQVRWRVTLPGDGPRRVTVTDGLTLVQYFRTAGRVTIDAVLEWQGETVEVPRPVEIDVLENREYKATAALESVEAAGIGLAALFAVLTGIGTQYDATFGSFNQYTGLFLWAAGASLGGNLFKQRGTGRSVGGQEAQLPGR